MESRTTINDLWERPSGNRQLFQTPMPLADWALYLMTDMAMDQMQWIGIIAGVLTSGSMVPQVVKVAKEKKAAELSVLMLLVLIIGIGLWIVYGIKKSDLPIVATNSFSLLVNGVLLALRIKYKDA